MFNLKRYRFFDQTDTACFSTGHVLCSHVTMLPTRKMKQEARGSQIMGLNFTALDSHGPQNSES